MSKIDNEVRPDAEFIKEKETRDKITVELKKEIPQEIQDILDETDKHEDRIEILLLEILRSLKPKTSAK